VYFRTASAAFVAPPGAELTVEALVDTLGLTGGGPPESRVALGIHDADTIAFEGQWPVVGHVWGRVDHLEEHGLVEVFFAYNRFLELLPEAPVPLPDDPLKPLADAFRTAASRLRALVGWVDAMAHYGDEDWENRTGSTRVNAALARRFLDEGAQALVEERLPLLWIRQDIDWEGPLFDREFESTPDGWLLWAGDEDDRWT